MYAIMWGTIVLIILYTPIIYRIHRRLAALEQKVNELAMSIHQGKWFPFPDVMASRFQEFFATSQQGGFCDPGK